MPYATNNMISQRPISNGIEITEESYMKLLEGMMAGKVVAIVEGEAVLQPKGDHHA